MSGILDLFSAQAGINEPALQALPSSPGQRFSAEMDAATTPDRYFNIQGARRDWYQKTVDELHEKTGQTLLNPLAPTTPEEMFKNGVAVAPSQIVTDRHNALIEANRTLRDSDPDAINAEGIDQFIGIESDAVRQRAANLTGTGNGLAGFAGGALAPTPENIVGLLLPVSRLPTAAASAVGRTFLGNVLREGALQGAMNAGVTAASEGLDQLSKSETGTAKSLGEVATDVASAGAFGFALGSGVRALHLKWLGLPEKVRANAPLEVQDAFRVIEADSLYSGTNRLGVDPMLHERYQGNAFDAVMRGRPVDLADIHPELPMTGLGSILRSAPDKISVEGLGSSLDRVKALPDTEIEALGRQLKPETFAPLDAIDTKLKELDARTQAIHQEAGQIGLSDVADIDTAARLQDVEAQLGKKGLRKATRADLERERETITQSIDPNGQLSEELKNTRSDFFPQHAEDLKAIEAERATLTEQRKSAQSVADREVEAIRKRLDSLDAGRQFGENASPEQLAAELAKQPDLTEALGRADLDRQIRTVRDVLPAGGPRMPESKAIAAAPVEMTPEQAKALDGEVKRIVSGKDRARSEFRQAAIKDLDALDIEAKDAAAALQCVNNGGGIP
jgi:hypothetical protein